jgi:predicted PurR-regulated permease PerM
MITTKPSPTIIPPVLKSPGGTQASLLEALGRRRDQAAVKRILLQVDTMLAKYIRAQLALAGLSVVVYSASMLLLGFPVRDCPGGPGWRPGIPPCLRMGRFSRGYFDDRLSYSRTLWIAGLLALWRLLQDYVNSARIMGDSLELPLTVMFALMAGGQLGGIAGLYLSVPAIAIPRIVWMGLPRRATRRVQSPVSR